jgi:hypothetical protein
MENSAGMTSDDFSQIYLLLTCVPSKAAMATYTTNASASAMIAQVNINTATVPVLECIPGFQETDAENIVAYRENTLANQDPTQVPNIAWLLDQVPSTELVQAGPYLTGYSMVYSADIVTVTNDGRAFKRAKIVVDASSGTPMIVYRRDLTENGWPLDPTIRTKLRTGGFQGNANASTPGHLSFGVH